METAEKNILIAEFMGVSKIFGTGQLKYNSSWDWLMVVVEKIDTDILPDDNFISITYNRCLIEYPYEGITIEGLGNSRLEATYKAVIEFILWFNEQQEGWKLT